MINPVPKHRIQSSHQQARQISGDRRSKGKYRKKKSARVFAQLGSV